MHMAEKFKDYLLVLSPMFIVGNNPPCMHTFHLSQTVDRHRKHTLRFTSRNNKKPLLIN